MRYTACAAMVALGVSTASAFALDSSVTMTSPQSAAALWKKVGDFCGIANWHPAVEKRFTDHDLEGGGQTRISPRCAVFCGMDTVAAEYIRLYTELMGGVGP